jgi:phosphopantetheinyl transferase (holo-ACP synthase)
MEPEVVAEALEVVEIAGAAEARDTFTEGELRYARSKPDPERRLAARLAAKRAAVRVLGGDVPLLEVEVLRGRGGPPSLRLGPVADSRRASLGGGRLLVSLTHGRTHAAASVLLVRDT